MENLESNPKPELLQFPVKAVLLITAAAVFSGILAGGGIGALAFNFYGITQAEFFSMVSESDVGLEDRNFLRLTTFISQAFTFIVPSFFICWMMYKKDWTKFLKLNRPPHIAIMGMTLVFIISSMGLVQFSMWLNQLIPLPEWAVTLETDTEGIIKTFLTMETAGELALSFFVMAIIPAIGEELLFRGIIQQTLSRAFKNEHVAVWVAALVFSFFHFQFAGFLPRMLLGGLLGYLLVWTKNLWVPIFGHLVFNGMQVIAIYYKDFLEENVGVDNLEDQSLDAIEMPAVGLIIFSAILVPVIGRTIQRFSK
ncbi:MAG: membrane protease YdiL (CAAX protease family) [Paraglaciecola sp.]|jgi:membrane protease YdiL (CAAX protease family)